MRAHKAKTKRCARCGATKPLTAFYRDRRATDQRQSWCIACAKSYIRAWRLRYPARVAAGRRHWKRKNRTRHVAYCTAYTRAYRRRPEPRRKYEVRHAAYWAARAGLIPRKRACERCGAPDSFVRLQMHHPDYDRPLQIVWLCRRCHGAVHRKTEGT